ncbi:uncharacterized protein BO97DRAFT_354162 [Aspergillus homomorphus CBS 101889]|uniref:Thioesterase/thiol ester dehydrase-isomerase n=1 Tax=Aspergillus homomorphus (strain CBS 101889) TaxID=1450537 RepID=A0A395HNG4_ASPHC|nr:hypothetical protein BO97DRAFT_354162 [Aspergillus homomorphus CBS 101889]RAL08378.1 hypothetical protein BO97DRAFT_354162 [Aspergillus homomorphus CBS 101889]
MLGPKSPSTRSLLVSSREQWRPAATRRQHSSFSERLYQKLTAQPLPFAFDYIYPQQSFLLDRTFSGFLPQPDAPLDALPSINKPSCLPPGHHLVYFPPQVPLSQLLPDGTDILHYPGYPFTRRLWAGGTVRFPATRDLLLDGRRAVCIETIRDVLVKGQTGEEKVTVRVERRIGTVQEGENYGKIRDRIWKEEEADPGHSSIIEHRNLVFMREKTPEQLTGARANHGQASRTIKSPTGSLFRHQLTPTRALLFRFSALTFNAHSIHLDQMYTRETEGYSDLLVHGPLTLVLLLAALGKHIDDLGSVIKEITYRNIAPLFVGEQMTICGKPKAGNHKGAWDVWIEGKDGGLAVRGTVQCDLL